MEKNVTKWKKMVVDVQNKVFYRRSIRLCGDFMEDFYRIYEYFTGDFDNKTLWRLYVGLLQIIRLLKIFLVLYRYIVIFCYI